MPLCPLVLWSNFYPGTSLDHTVNVGASWLIAPDGTIPKEDYHNFTPEEVGRGLLKAYNHVEPNSLVIHWNFPNIYVGHILWVSQAPTKLTKAQIATVRRIEKQLAKEWDPIARRQFIMTPPLMQSHWDLEKYTRTVDLPTVRRGRDQDLALEQISPETIKHYAELLEGRQHEFTDLDLDLVISREKGVAYYTGNNGLRTYPLDKLGYHNICRALCRVKAYRRKQQVV